MRIPVTDEEMKLMEIFDPYFVHAYPNNHLTDDAPEEAKKAFERFMEIGRKQQEEMLAFMF